MEPTPVPHNAITSNSTNSINPTEQELAADLLRGADEIAAFIFGERGSRRKVYYLAEHTRIPLFRLGSQLCARRSVLLRWIAGQESKVRTSIG